jgi:hypothetical protein
LNEDLPGSFSLADADFAADRFVDQEAVFGIQLLSPSLRMDFTI